MFLFAFCLCHYESVVATGDLRVWSIYWSSRDYTRIRTSYLESVYLINLLTNPIFMILLQRKWSHLEAGPTVRSREHIAPQCQHRKSRDQIIRRNNLLQNVQRL
jgi:hypothetical protein